MKFKEFIINMLSTIGAGINSKIVAGFISLFATITFGIFSLNESMWTMGILTSGFFGLSSLDLKQGIKNQEVKEKEE